MKVTLEQHEIEEAVQAYVRTQINVAENQEIGIDFSMGRSPTNLTASLDIRAFSISVPATEAVAPAPAAKPVACLMKISASQ